MIAFAYAVRGGAFVFLLLNLFYTIYVMYLYRKANKVTPREYGLHAVHVVFAGAGVFILQFALAWALGEGIKEGIRNGLAPTPSSIGRIAMYGVGSLIILIALFIIAKMQRVRIKYAKRIREATITTEEC